MLKCSMKPFTLSRSRASDSSELRNLLGLRLRHGVDAAHIANTTRKLMQENQHPFTVGLWPMVHPQIGRNDQQ